MTFLNFALTTIEAILYIEVVEDRAWVDLALNPPSEMVEQKETKQLLRPLPMDNLHIQQK